MDCQRCRDALSAHLDGEEHEDFDAHLDGCASCQSWFDRATTVTRLARIGLAVPPVGVPASVLDAAPRPAGRSLVTILRIMLGAVGAAQLLLAVAQIAGEAMVGMSTLGSTQGATPGHLVHETAAWNIGVGAAFLLIAARFARPASVVGVLTVFVGALAILSADDLISGAVTRSRLASHLLLVVGYALVVVLSRPRFSRHEPPASRGSGRSRWRLTLVEEDTRPIQLHRGTVEARSGYREAA